jgi:predicted RNase H-like nuclease (RuvC/YqgF family)
MRYLILFVTFLLSSVTGNLLAQVRNGDIIVSGRDTSIVVPLEAVTQAVIDKRQNKKLKELVDELKVDIARQEAKILNLENQIAEEQNKVAIGDNISATQKEVIAELKEALRIAKDSLNRLEKKLKWANTKTVIVGVLGLALTVLALVK